MLEKIAMNYRISDCREIADERLCAAMNAAFADYVVPLKLTEEGFRTFQRQRGFSPKHSFVAHHGDDIVAFWLSGKAIPEQEGRAYTLSVGTRPDHRRRGLSRQLLKAVVEAHSRDPIARGLQLEVITSNQAAIGSYENMGFHRHRTLRILKLADEPVSPTGGPVILPIALDDLPLPTDAFFDVQPTPQNDRPALKALSPDIHLVGLTEGDTLIGWGASFTDGAVAQVAVHRNFRRRGYGRALLHALWQVVGQGSLTFVNVDDSAAGLNGFLEAVGAEEVLQQYEMRLDFT